MGRLIVHWSPLHGQAKTTASMGAVALAMNQITKDRVCVTHTQFGMSDLEGMFDNRPGDDRKAVLYQAAGLNALITDIKRNRLTDDDVNSCAVGTVCKNVDLIPGIEVKDMQTVGEEMNLLVFKIITDAVKSYYDWTFVDLAAGNNPQSKKFMDAADIIVITLSQNCTMWDNLFECYPELVKQENVFFLFGGHKKESSYNSRNFARIFRSHGIETKRVGLVPDCTGYMDAISDGLVPEFFAKFSKKSSASEEKRFIEECCETAVKLKGMLEVKTSAEYKEDVGSKK